MVGMGLLVVAAALLLAGAELFTDHAARAGAWLGVSGLAVGLLLAGAEPEELVTGLIAAAGGRSGIAVGDALGANVTMLSAVLGSAALIRGVRLGARVHRYLFGATATGVVAALVVRGGMVARPEGVGLVALYGLLVVVVWRTERAPPAVGEVAELAGDGTGGVATGAWRDVALALVGVVVMTAGGWFAVQGAVRIVSALDSTDGPVGATFVALATTAELFALVWAAARHDVEELAVAGIVGSAVYNATVTLGLPALGGPLDAAGLHAVAWLAAVLPLVVVALGGRRGRVGRAGGVVLVGVYLAYVMTLLWS